MFVLCVHAECLDTRSGFSVFADNTIMNPLLVSRHTSMVRYNRLKQHIAQERPDLLPSHILHSTVCLSEMDEATHLRGNNSDFDFTPDTDRTTRQSPVTQIVKYAETRTYSCVERLC